MIFFVFTLTPNTLPDGSLEIGFKWVSFYLRLILLILDCRSFYFTTLAGGSSSRKNLCHWKILVQIRHAALLREICSCVALAP